MQTCTTRRSLFERAQSYRARSAGTRTALSRARRRGRRSSLGLKSTEPVFPVPEDFVCEVYGEPGVLNAQAHHCGGWLATRAKFAADLILHLWIIGWGGRSVPEPLHRLPRFQQPS